MDLDALLDERSERDRFLAHHYASPLPDEDRARFSGLSYFAPDPAWVITGVLETNEVVEVPIASTSGSTSVYTKVGEAVVEIGSVEYRLVVLDDGDGGRFIPFRDATCGVESYTGGRYVGVAVHDETAVIDFNRARNPYCVYDEEFSCPLPPASNTIAVRVEAGEKMWVSQAR